MLKINKKTWIASLLVGILFVAAITISILMPNTKAYAAANSLSEQKVYHITFNRNQFTGDLDLNRNLYSISVTFYNSNKTEIVTFTKIRKDDANWSDNSDVTYVDSNAPAYYYSITYKSYEDIDGQYYWQIMRGGKDNKTYYKNDGSTEATTELISTAISTTIDATDNVMCAMAYKPLEVKITGSSWWFPAYWDWDFKIKNTNPFTVDVEYLSELCFEGDAATFGGNVTMKKSVELAQNEQSETLRINHNGTAGCFTFCMWISPIGIISKSCGKVVYGYDLYFGNNTGTFTRRDVVI